MKSGKRFAVSQLLFASVAASALMVGTALADPLPAQTWAGPYVGVNLGWYQNSVTANDLDGWFTGQHGWTNSLTGSGVLGGVQGGYNWQFDHIVLGVESDIDLGSANNSANFSGPSKYDEIEHLQSSLSALGTLRGRLGYAFDPLPLLVYGTAGVAFGSVNDSVQSLKSPNITQCACRLQLPSWNSNEWRGGFVVGGGLEYAFARNWSVKAEALYVDLGTDTVTTVIHGKTSYSDRFSFRNTAVIARGGINYKF